jgi:hypothetical protein
MRTGVSRVSCHLKFATLILLLTGAAVASEPLTNEIIIKMVQSGVPTETIVRTIQSAESFHFGTLPGDLIQLQQAKVPDEIIRALAARINYPGTSWRIIVPTPLAPPPTAPAPAAPPAAPPAATRAVPPIASPLQSSASKPDTHGDGYLYRGAVDLGFAASGIISHGATGSSVGMADVTGGYFLSRGNMIGGGMTGVFTSTSHDIFVSGNYRYFVKTGDPKLFPFVGGGAGINTLSGFGSGHNLLGKAELGVRYFAARHVAVDVAYDLEYVRSAGADFSQSSYSAISIGFAHIF